MDATTRTTFGPACVAERHRWGCCDYSPADDPEPEFRAYVVSLPVTVHVSDDGTVRYVVDTAGAPGELLDLDTDEYPDAVAVYEDAKRVRAEHDARHTADPDAAHAEALAYLRARLAGE